MFNINVFVQQREIHHLQFRMTHQAIGFLLSATLSLALSPSLSPCDVYRTSEPYQIGIKATHYNRMSYSYMLWTTWVEQRDTTRKWIRARNDCHWNENFGEWKMAISLEPTSYNITRTPYHIQNPNLNDDTNSESSQIFRFCAEHSELWHFHTAYIVTNKINSHTHFSQTLNLFSERWIRAFVCFTFCRFS